MYCVKCGCKLDDDAVFCTECGTKVPMNKNEVIQDNTVVETKKQVVTQEEIYAETTSEEKKGDIGAAQSKKETSYKKYVLCGVIGLAIVAVCCVVLNRNPKIDLNSYLTIEVSGYDSIGVADVEFDYDKFRADLEETASTKKGPEPEFEDGSFEEFAYGFAQLMKENNDDIREAIRFSIDKEETLSNGDTIEITWYCNDDYIKEKYGCDLKYKDITYKVDSLEAVKIINPFDEVEVKANKGSLAVFFTVINHNSDEVLSKLEYDVESKQSVKAGDTLVVTVKSDPKEFIEQYGVSWKDSTMNYKVTEDDVAGTDYAENKENKSKENDHIVEGGYFVRDINDIIKGNHLSTLYDYATRECKDAKIDVIEGNGIVNIENITTIGLDFYPNGDECSGETNIPSMGVSGKRGEGFIVNKLEYSYVDTNKGINETWEAYYPVILSEVVMGNDKNYLSFAGDPPFYNLCMNIKEIESESGVIKIQYEGFEKYNDYLGVVDTYFHRDGYRSETAGPVQRNYDFELYIEPENDEANADSYVCELAKKYYKKKHGQIPPIAEIDSRNGNEVAIHLYEMMVYEDYPEENHTATWDWYWVDIDTLIGEDNMGDKVDLNEVK